MAVLAIASIVRFCLVLPDVFTLRKMPKRLRAAQHAAAAETPRRIAFLFLRVLPGPSAKGRRQAAIRFSTGVYYLILYTVSRPDNAAGKSFN